MNKKYLPTEIVDPNSNNNKDLYKDLFIYINDPLKFIYTFDRIQEQKKNGKICSLNLKCYDQHNTFIFN
jgi:hypothetical protein